MNTTDWNSGAAPGISADLLNEPFHIRSTSYSAPNLSIVIGPGRADFSTPGTVVLAVIPYTTTVTLTQASPALGTAYYIFLKPTNRNPLVAGDFRISTTATPLAGEARLGSVTTDAVSLSNPATRADLRGLLVLPSLSLTTTVSDIKAVNATAVLGTSVLAAPADHQHAVASGNVVKDGTLQTNLNADLLDGLNSGNASGNIPVSNGTVNTNLNADMVDGFHAGNSAGQVPLNNGTLNSTLNADLLDGLNSGNASGNIPISNGTLNTNLNADLLDGLNSGNASGNIPVSNGTVNTNLNADMTDGFHAAAGTVAGVLIIGANKAGTIEPKTIYTANTRPTSDTGVLEGDLLING